MCKRILLLAAAALIVLSAGCSGTPPRNDTAAELGDGPTLYGQLGVSVDYVEAE